MNKFKQIHIRKLYACTISVKTMTNKLKFKILSVLFFCHFYEISKKKH